MGKGGREKQRNNLETPGRTEKKEKGKGKEMEQYEIRPAISAGGGGGGRRRQMMVKPGRANGCLSTCKGNHRYDRYLRHRLLP